MDYSSAEGEECVALCLRFSGDDAHQPTVVALMVANVAVHGCKDGPVAADAHAITGMESGPKLANDDVPGFYKLTVTAFYTAVLWIGVATVPGASLSFFVCHL